MNGNWCRIGQAAAAGITIVALISACSSSGSGLSTRSANASGDTAATGASASPDTILPDTILPDTILPDTSSADTAVTTADTAALGGAANRPEGTWTVIRRLEQADPPYDSFIAGQPDAQQWVIHPQCDDGPCDLRVEPGDNGYYPAGWPTVSAGEPRPFTLELQTDGSYLGRDMIEQPTCSGANSTEVDNGGEHFIEYHLVYLAADGSEAPRLEGTLTDNQKPDAAALQAGCIEFHDVQGLIAQPLDYWKGVDPATLTFGTYDWGGLVADADQYYLDHTGAIGSYVHFNSELALQSGCDGAACDVTASGVVPAYGDKTGTFHWDGAELVAETPFEDTCVKNDTHEVIVQHGFDIVDTIEMSPAIIVGGDVLAWTGSYSEAGMPTDAAAAASPEDCFTQHQAVAIAVSTTQPFFHGL